MIRRTTSLDASRVLPDAVTSQSLREGNDSLAVVTTADDRYFIPLIALAKSIEMNLRSCMPATMYVIDGGLSRRHRREIERCLSPARLTVEWVCKPPRAALGGMPIFGHVNICTYYRILVPDLFPQLAKIIYLDADTLVLGDLGELWRMPMDGAPLMAVQEWHNATMRSESVPGYRDLGIPDDAKVLNGGMLVMDLNVWRREKVPMRVSWTTCAATLKACCIGIKTGSTRFWLSVGRHCLHGGIIAWTVRALIRGNSKRTFVRRLKTRRSFILRQH